MSEKDWEGVFLAVVLVCIAICAAGGQHLWATGFLLLLILYAQSVARKRSGK